jgi:hypothetical protein
MKKLLLAAVFMLAVIAVNAQPVTHQSIQGKWKLIYVEANGISIDGVKGTYAIADEVKASMDEAELQDMEGAIETMMSEGMDGTVEFTQDVMSEEHVEGGETIGETSKYVFKAGTPATVEFTKPDGSKGMLEVSLDKGNLVLFEPVDQAKVVYKKLKQ